jgi:quinol monooxygenase YgiN
MNGDPIVLINTFHVNPDDAERLVATLSEATETVVRGMPGFLSATFHVSLDRSRVVNYAKWRSLGDLQAMLQDPKAKPHLDACIALAKSFEPVVYRAVAAHVA